MTAGSEQDGTAVDPRRPPRRPWSALGALILMVIVGYGLALLVARWSLGSGEAAERQLGLLAIAFAVTAATALTGVIVAFLFHRPAPQLPADQRGARSGEAAADRWVLLAPPRRARVRRRRAFVVIFPVLLVAAYAFSAFSEPDPSPPIADWRSALTVLGLIVTTLGTGWAWRAAAAPDAIAGELDRLALRPATARTRRDLLRRLRHGRPLQGADRPAAAALAASRHDDHFKAGLTLTYAGFFLALAPPYADDLASWLPCAIAGVIAFCYQLVSVHARHVQHAADRAGLAPLVGDTRASP